MRVLENLVNRLDKQGQALKLNIFYYERCIDYNDKHVHVQWTMKK